METMIFNAQGSDLTPEQRINFQAFSPSTYTVATRLGWERYLRNMFTMRFSYECPAISPYYLKNIEQLLLDWGRCVIARIYEPFGDTYVASDSWGVFNFGESNRDRDTGELLSCTLITDNDIMRIFDKEEGDQFFEIRDTHHNGVGGDVPFSHVVREFSFKLTECDLAIQQCMEIQKQPIMYIVKKGVRNFVEKIRSAMSRGKMVDGINENDISEKGMTIEVNRDTNVAELLNLQRDYLVEYAKLLGITVIENQNATYTAKAVQQEAISFNNYLLHIAYRCREFYVKMMGDIGLSFKSEIDYVSNYNGVIKDE